MRKKILINEESIEKIKDSVTVKLPDFIYSAIRTNNTSLGDSEAFPPDDEYGFAYSLVKNRFTKVSDRLGKYGYDDVNEDFLLTRLNKLIHEAVKAEKPLHDALETLCFNIVNDVLGTPEDTVNLHCKIGKVDVKANVRITPESTFGSDEYTFDDIDEITFSNRSVAKRRVINSLIQGISYSLMTSSIKKYADKISSFLSPEILKIYREILDIDNYLLFIKKEEINEKKMSQTAYVEVRLGHGNERTNIKSQGLIFPYLLKETFRGYLELFSSHGLPKDNKKAMYIIRKADFMLAEPWDLRFGVPMWDLILKNCDKFSSRLIPYIFSDICALNTDEFYDIMKNLLARTGKGQEFLNNEINNVKNEFDYELFKSRIQQKNNNNSILTDGYMTEEDLDGLLNEDGEVEDKNDTYGL